VNGISLLLEGGNYKNIFPEAKKNKAINTLPGNHSPKFA
jgi:hypothetical protein